MKFERMEKLTILFFVSTLALTIGHPANILIDSNSDDFFGANSLDADPISSEQAEQYKQQLLRQQKLQQELLLEAQRVTTQNLQNTEKAITDKVEDEVKVASTSTVQPEEVHTEKEKISTPVTTSTMTPPTTHSTTVSPISAPSTTPTVSQGPTRPQRNPQHVGMLSRIIDDIFQIPISVIQSVARLLRNPFSPRRTPESASTY